VKKFLPLFAFFAVVGMLAVNLSVARKTRPSPMKTPGTTPSTA